MRSVWGKQQSRVVVLDDGFEAFRGTESVGKTRFDAIIGVEAYKRDELTTDLICFDILVEAELPMTWRIHEEVEGWPELVEALQRLPGFDADWHAKVFQPAFAESRIVIYDRPAK
jgi:hypothetical protein